MSPASSTSSRPPTELKPPSAHGASHRNHRGEHKADAPGTRGDAWYRGQPADAELLAGLSEKSSITTYVGLAGFEPAASCTQSTRARQTALQPVLHERS